MLYKAAIQVVALGQENPARRAVRGVCRTPVAVGAMMRKVSLSPTAAEAETQQTES